MLSVPEWIKTTTGLIFHSIILINLKVCLGRCPNLLEKMPLSVSVFIGFRLPGPVRQRGVDNRSQDSWERPVNCPVWHLYFVFRNVLHLTPQSSTLFYQIHWYVLSSHKQSSINKTNLYSANHQNLSFYFNCLLIFLMF